MLTFGENPHFGSMSGMKSSFWKQCPPKMPRKRVGRVSHKSALQKCPTGVSHKSVLQECATRASDNSLLLSPTKSLPPRMSYQSVRQERPRGMTLSNKTVAHECPTQSLECVCVCVCVCVCQTLFLRAVHVQGAIPFTSGGWPPKRRLVRAANVPAQATPTPMVLPPRFCCFHGGFHAIPLNLPRRVAAEPLVKQLLNIPSALTPSPCRSLVPFTVDWMSL